MSQTVDNRVVELQFDNQQFEQGTKESLNTIQKLKEALKFKDAGENLKDLGNVTKNFDLNGIGNAVEQVGEKFSTMRLVGLMALSNIVDGAMQAGKKILQAFTAPLNQIKTGGWNRAMNIEDAKFQLKGLGVAWEEVADDIDYAVSGTAYGLDSAAKAASQLTASGVKSGEAMKAALRGISGVAAMANTSYEEISPIFTTVAGQGKLMTMQLRQLESRGLNAAATLGKALGKSEQEIRDMVTKGKIDFDTFAKAMDDAFGEHAKDANNTFTGALSNIKAALSRIGQNFATPIIQNAIPVFNKLRLIVNAINAGMKDAGVYSAFEKIAGIVKNIAVNNLSKIETFFKGSQKFIPNIVDTLKIGFTNVLRIFLSIKNAWDKVFTGSASKNLVSITAMFKRLAEVLTPSEKALRGLEKVFTAVFTILKKLGTAIGSVVKTIGPPLINIFMKIVNVGLTLLGVIADIITAVLNLASGSKILQTVFGAIALVISKVGDVFKNFKNKLTDSSTSIGKFTTALSNGFKLVASIVAGVLAVAINGIITLFNKLRSIDFSNFLNGLINIKNFIVDLLNYVRQLPIVQAIINGIANSFLFLIGIVVKVGEGFANLVKNIASGKMTFHDFAESLKSIVDKLGGLKAKLSNFLSTNPVILKFVEIFNKLRVAFDGFIKNTAARVKEIDGVRVILMAFAIGITAMVYKVTGAIGSFSKLLKTGSNAIETFIESIAPKKTSFFTTFAGNLLKIAAAIAVVAMSIKMVANIPADNLERATKSLLMLAGGAAVLAVLATVLGAFLKVGKDGFSAFSANMLMFSAGVGILASTLLILENVNMKGIWAKVAILGAIAAGLTGISIVMSKFAPKLAAGSIMMIAFAASVAILVKSLKELTTFDLSGLSGYWKELLALFGGLALVAAAVGKVGIGAVAGLVAFIVAWKLISTKMDDLQKAMQDIPYKISSIGEGIKNAFANLQTQMGISRDEAIGAIVAFSAIVVGIITVLAIVGAGLKDFAKSLVIISAVVVGLIYVSKYIAKWLDESPRMGEAISLIGEMMVFVGGLIALSGFGNAETLKQTKKMLASLSVAVLAMTAFIAVAGKLDAAEWSRATTALELALLTIGGFAVAIASINSKSTGTKAGITSFLGIIALFGVMFGALAVLMTQLRDTNDYFALAVSLGAILTLVLFIDSMLLALSKVRVGKGWAPILALFVGLGILVGTIGGTVKLIISNLNEGDMARAWSALGLLMAGLAVITGVALGIQALMKNKAFNATKTSIANLKMFGAIIIALTGILVVLGVLAAALENVDGGKIIGHLEALTLVVAELAGIAVLMSLFAKNGSQKGIQSAIIAIGVMTACFAAIGGIAYALQDVNGGKIIGHLQAITLVIGELAGIAILLSLFAKNTTEMAVGVAAIAAMSSCFVAISKMAIALEDIDGGKLIGHTQAIALVIGELAGIAILMSLFATNALGIAAGVAAIAVMTICFVQLGNMAVTLKDIDGGVILGHLSAISLVILELSVILVLLGALVALTAPALIGVLGIIAICSAMKTLADILKQLEGMSAGSITATLSALSLGLLEISAVGIVATVAAIGLLALSVAIKAIGEACLNVGEGITKFANGMKELSSIKDELPAVTTAIVDFFSSFKSGMIEEISSMGTEVNKQIYILTQGIAISLQQGLLSAAGVAYQGASAIGLNIVNGFNAGTGGSNAGWISKFKTDVSSQLRNTSDIQATTKQAWFNVGKATEIGYREGARWHSPPEWLTAFFNDFNAGIKNGEGFTASIAMGATSAIGKSMADGFANSGAMQLPNDVGNLMSQMSNQLGTNLNFTGNFDYSSLMNQLYNMEDDVAAEAERIKAILNEIGMTETQYKQQYQGLRQQEAQLKKNAEYYRDLAKQAENSRYGAMQVNGEWKTSIELYQMSNREKAKANKIATEYTNLNLPFHQKKVAETTEEAAEATNDLAKGLGGAGGAAKKASDELQQFGESLRSTLEGQMDVFSEFKKAEGHTKEELFKNIESQINGMAAWAVNMDKLSERGIDQGLYQKLAEMGPQGAGYMEAFLSMTQEELAKYNDLWATSLVLPDTVSTMLTGSLQKAGENSMLGLYNGVKGGHQQVVDEFTNVATESVETVENEWDTHSPSVVFHEKGKDAMEGLRLGLMHGQGNVFARITFICQHIVALADTGLQPGKFAEFGGNIIQGLVSGIESSEQSIWDKLTTITTKIKETITTALKIKSPSKVMMEYGGYISEGLAIGIGKGEHYVTDATHSLADSVIEDMRFTLANIAAQVNDSFEDPVITPVLDLSNVRAGARDLNNIFNANQAAVRAGSFTSNQNGQEIGSGAVIFNQNNYSPKALSRIEIYRDTRNLFAQAKGALS